MTTGTAQTLVVTGVAGSATLAGIREAVDGSGPSWLRLGIGTFAAAALLAVLAQVWPALAGGLAVLMLLTSTFVYGGPAFDAITNLTSRKA